MKKLLLILFFAIGAQTASFAQTRINSSEASKHLGKRVTLTDIVYDGRYFSDSESKIILLNLGAPFPNSLITVMIPKEVRANMSIQNPETALKGEHITVTGIITEYKGKQQIILNSASDLKVEKVVRETVQLEMVPNNSTQELLVDVEEAKEAEEPIFTVVEQQPTFADGDSKMIEFIKINLKYPPAAKRSSLEGLVVVQFVVKKDGTIKDVQVVKKLGLGTDEETVRLIKSMPKFTPAKQNGRPVAFRYTYPVPFSLTNP